MLIWCISSGLREKAISMFVVSDKKCTEEDMMLVGDSSYDPLMNTTVNSIIVILPIILLPVP